jgi:hypothetical protein
MNKNVQGRVSYDNQKHPRVQDTQLNSRAERGCCPDAAKNRPTSKVIFLVLLSKEQCLLENMIGTQLIKNLFTCSQEHATGPYPEPDKSSPHPHTLFIQERFQYYPPIYV